MRHLSIIYRTIINIIICMLIIPCFTHAQTKIGNAEAARASAAIILQQPINDPRIQNRKHELVPCIATTPNGKQIYIAWYSGGPGEGPGNYVTLAVSLDTGRTWKNDQLIIYPKNSSTRFFDPSLWADKFGKIWLFYAVSMDNEYWDLKGGVNAIEIEWNGSKVIYEKPKLLSYGIMLNKPIYVPKKDFALFPVSIWQLGVDHSNEPGFIKTGTFIEKFDYKNKKTKLEALSSYSYIDVLPDSMRTFDEHQIVQSSDKGDFLCMVRTKKGIYYSKSSDYGKTWSVLEPFTSTGPTTSSRFYIGRLQSGNLIMVLNNSRTRNNMTVFLSKDGGETWPHKLLLDHRDKVSYPDVAQTDDGVIHVTYDRDRSGAKDILYCHFKEEDIINSSEQNIFKIKVNKHP